MEDQGYERTLTSGFGNGTDGGATLLGSVRKYRRQETNKTPRIRLDRYGEPRTGQDMFPQAQN